MKKNIIITILCVLVVGLGCFIVYDKVINKNESKCKNTDLASTNCPACDCDGTKNEGNSQSYVEYNVLLNEGPKGISASIYDSSSSKALSVVGINENAISTVKTYSCGPETFEFGVLGESGAIYVYDNDEAVLNKLEKLNFSKVNSSVKFKAIMTIPTSKLPGNENAHISCDGSVIIGYDEDFNMYEIEHDREKNQFVAKKLG